MPRNGAGIVELDHVLQCGEHPVVHIGSGQLDIAQAGRAEGVAIRHLAGVLLPPDVIARQHGPARSLLGNADYPKAEITENGAAVALAALRRGEEQLEPALLLSGESIVIPGGVSVKGCVPGCQFPLVGGQRPAISVHGDDVAARCGGGLQREGGAEALNVFLDLSEAGNDAVARNVS